MPVSALRKSQRATEPTRHLLKVWRLKLAYAEFVHEAACAARCNRRQRGRANAFYQPLAHLALATSVAGYST